MSERNAMSVTPLTLDTNTSWLVASTAVGIASVSFGAPYIAVVALKPIRPISAVRALCRRLPSRWPTLARRSAGS
jgi:hypothetical protein